MATTTGLPAGPSTAAYEPGPPCAPCKLTPTITSVSTPALIPAMSFERDRCASSPPATTSGAIAPSACAPLPTCASPSPCVSALSATASVPVPIPAARSVAIPVAFQAGTAPVAPGSTGAQAPSAVVGRAAELSVMHRSSDQRALSAWTCARSARSRHTTLHDDQAQPGISGNSYAAETGHPRQPQYAPYQPTAAASAAPSAYPARCPHIRDVRH